MSLIREYDRVFRPGPKWAAPPRPTAESLAKISRALDLPGLPTLLVRLADEAKYFGVWFAGLGPDYESRTHILQLNKYWRESGLPLHLILITYGFDAVCDCLDKNSSDVPDNFRVVQTQLCDGVFDSHEVFASDFEQYLVKIVGLFRSRPRIQ